MSGTTELDQRHPAASFARYVTKPIPVTAVHWRGEENCEEVFAFLGWAHPDDELDHTLITGIGADGQQEAEPGNWIVHDTAFDIYEVFTDAAFQEQFEAVGDA